MSLPSRLQFLFFGVAYRISVPPSFPHDKVQNLIAAINKELNAFYMQCEEIVIKNRIPTEIGEPKIISISDTTRNAKVINFDDLEQKEIQKKK